MVSIWMVQSYNRRQVGPTNNIHNHFSFNYKGWPKINGTDLKIIWMDWGNEQYCTSPQTYFTIFMVKMGEEHASSPCEGVKGCYLNF